jgi:hypothetical protein
MKNEYEMYVNLEQNNTRIKTYRKAFGSIRINKLLQLSTGISNITKLSAYVSVIGKLLAYPSENAPRLSTF